MYGLMVNESAMTTFCKQSELCALGVSLLDYAIDYFSDIATSRFTVLWSDMAGRILFKMSGRNPRWNSCWTESPFSPEGKQGILRIEYFLDKRGSTHHNGDCSDILYCMHLLKLPGYLLYAPTARYTVSAYVSRSFQRAKIEVEKWRVSLF